MVGRSKVMGDSLESKKSGCIYILTNPSFPQYVKIGYADDVEERVRTLNASTAVPFAFRIYATYETTKKLADKPLHDLIDKINPDIRSRDNVDGKIRTREFYAMSPEDAFEILRSIAAIHSEESFVKEYNPSNVERKKQQLEDKIAEEDIQKQTERQPPFSFSQIGIEPGSILEYIKDPAIICTVVDDRRVKYKGRVMYLSGIASELNDGKSLNGAMLFRYNGKLISELRTELDGKSNSIKIQESNVVKLNESKSKSCVKTPEDKKRAPPFRFTELGIVPGSELFFDKDPSVKCTVLDDRKVKYHGKVTTLSKLTSELMGGGSYNGALFFRYNGELISKLRKQKESKD